MKIILTVLAGVGLLSAGGCGMLDRSGERRIELYE